MTCAYDENHTRDGRAGVWNVYGVDEVNYDEVQVVGWWWVVTPWLLVAVLEL
jgi:hypothetical protein